MTHDRESLGRIEYADAVLDAARGARDASAGQRLQAMRAAIAGLRDAWRERAAAENAYLGLPEDCGLEEANELDAILAADDAWDIKGAP